MKKKFIIVIILITLVFLLCGCNETGNVEIKYDDMEKFAGVWFNQSGINPEYFLITKDGNFHSK